MNAIASQVEMQLFPVKEVEVNGVQMGVLNDGSPYLSLRGLAKLCGVNHQTLQPLTANWLEEKTKPRGAKIKKLLLEHGYTSDKLFTIVNTGSNWESHAYPDAVCMAILEYYAFDATLSNNIEAAKNYRLLARQTLRTYIFKNVGIDPENPVIGAWKCFQERIMLNDSIPAGYFSVFRELVDITVPLISAGFELNSKNVIDISAGTRWAAFWKRNQLSEKYGQPQKYPHIYPEWFPQHKAGPVEANIYPESALGEFRKWLREHYVSVGLKEYLADKVKSKAIENKKAIEVLEFLKRPELPKKS
jgi:hypothetical protein